MHVLAVGKWLVLSSFDMHIFGFIELNPNVGGLEHEVTYSKNFDLSSAENYYNTCHKCMIVISFSWYSV